MFYPGDEQNCWFAGEVIDWARVPAKVEGVIEKRMAKLDKELQNLLVHPGLGGLII